MTITPPQRWQALDALRGLSVIGMLLTLNPGAWEQEYSWLQHVKWQGGHLIDMVSPTFLFCVGASIPMSLQNRVKAGLPDAKILTHILQRSLILVLLGVFLNGYPDFDLAHLRVNGVLQHIGIAFGAVSLLVLLTSKRDPEAGLIVGPRPLLIAATAILLGYWALLFFVPVPGFGAPRFDPVGSWPAYVDRTLFGVDHMFKYWPVDGKVVFDPDGLLLSVPVCFNVLFGALVSTVYRRGLLKRPLAVALICGSLMMLAALALNGVCPIIKNIWTSTFALFAGGFTLVLLALLTAAFDRSPSAPKLLFPALVFGSNALLAYVFCWLIAPGFDINFLPNASFGRVSIRWGSQLALRGFLPPQHASFAFSVGYLSLVFLMLWGFYKKRWFWKL